MPLTESELQDIVLALVRERDGRIAGDDLFEEMRRRVRTSADALVTAGLLEHDGEWFELTHGGWTIAGGLRAWSDPPKSIS